MKWNLLTGFLLLAHVSLSQVNTQSVNQSFKQFVDQRNPGNLSGSLPAFNVKEDTEGFPFLMQNWSKGKVFLKNKTQLQEATNSLNFDKQKQILLVKVSDKIVLEVDMKEIQGFELYDNTETKRVVQLNNDNSTYYVELYKDSLFSLYKTVKTKFYKADYVNKGLYETGFKYDRYVDENKYYLKKKDGKVLVIENTSKKQMSKLAEDLPVIKAFIKNNAPLNDTEAYLISLTMFLNQQ